MIQASLWIGPIRFAAILLVLFFSPLAQAQTPETTPAATPSHETIPSQSLDELTVEKIEANRKEVAVQTANAVPAATESTARQLGVGLDRLTDRVERLRALDSVYQQQIGALQRLEELRASRVDLDQEISSFEERGFEESPPYNLSFTDRLHDETVAERRQVESLQEALKTAETDQQNTQERLSGAERDRRAAVETADGNTDASLGPRLSWEANRSRLEERFYSESLKARRLRKRIVQQELDYRIDRLVFSDN